MSKRNDVLKSVELTLELLKGIRKDRLTTASELRQSLIDTDARFERELRTIQRILESLTDPEFNTFNIERDERSKPYGYRYKAEAKSLTLPGLNPQEALLLTLAEQQLAKLLPARLMRSMDGFFSQARHQLTDLIHPTDKQGAKAKLEREWLNKVRVLSTSQPLLPPKVDENAFQEVSDALYGNQWLDISYKNASGHEASYKIMPLGLVQQGPRLYLACQFDGHDNYRCLALHRMISAKASTLTFERPVDFDLKQLDDDLVFSEESPKFIRLSFRIDKGNGLHIVECPLSADQQVVVLDDGYEISATVVDSDVLERWLLGFGDGVSGVNKISLI
jgi:predicted DNA-binding transcriptional regulator YafY